MLIPDSDFDYHKENKNQIAVISHGLSENIEAGQDENIITYGEESFLFFF